MEEGLRTWAKDMVWTIQSIIDRINSNTLSGNDRNSVGVMLIQLEQAIRSATEYEQEPAMQDIAARLHESFSALMENDAALLQQNQDELRQLMSFGSVLITRDDRQRDAEFKPREDGRTYIDLNKDLNLPRMPREQFMQYTEHLKSIGAKYDPEARQWYVEADWQPPESVHPESISPKHEKNNNTDKEGKVEAMEINEVNGTVGQKENKESSIMDREHGEIVNAETEINEKFRAIYYEESERMELFAETKESAISLVRESRTIEPKETDRCYIQEYNAETDKYQAEGIYLISSGRDITPVEIRLPHMSSEAFEEVRKGIKEMGVRFDGDKKMWYVERSTPAETMQNIKSLIDSHDASIYLKLPYMTPETYKEVREKIKEMGAKFNGDKKMWYADYNTQKETVDNIINFIASHDEATYLQLPSQTGKEQFKKMTAQLKQDGARFNPDKKAWYITEKQDKSKFAAYLPSEKPSVLGKLEQNKETAAKNNHEKEKAMEPRNKDVPEIA